MSIWIKLFMSINVGVYRLSHGRVSGYMLGYTILLLHTRGRKSGIAYTIPLTYFREGENYLVIASNWGKAHHPGWYYNLLHQPKATIQVRDQILSVTAHQANGAEYSWLWKKVTDRENFYVRYQKRTRRQIPIIVLTPDGKQ